MSHNEPNGQRPEATTPSLHDLHDQGFKDMFLHDPERSKFADTRAENMSGTILEIFAGDPSIYSPEIPGKLRSVLKKAIFLFTDPNNLDDTLSDEEVMGALEWHIAPTEPSAAQAIEAFNLNINFCMATYKMQAQERAGVQWDKLSQYAKLWESLKIMVGDAQAPVDDPPNLAIGAMVRKTISVIGGLQKHIGIELYSQMMEVGLQEGYTYDNLQEFHGADNTRCFGFYRDKRLYCGACKYPGPSGTLDAIIVKTTGEFGGTWVFGLEGSFESVEDIAVLAKRNNRPIVEYNGHDHMALVRAVIRSALTETLEKQSILRKIFG